VHRTQESEPEKKKLTRESGSNGVSTDTDRKIDKSTGGQARLRCTLKPRIPGEKKEESKERIDHIRDRQQPVPNSEKTQTARMKDRTSTDTKRRKEGG